MSYLVEPPLTPVSGSPFGTTYNPWNLPESTIEPATPAYPNTADRTFTTVYDAAGQVAKQLAPGGVTITNTYNSIGNLTGQPGAGAEAATAARASATTRQGE